MANRKSEIPCERKTIRLGIGDFEAMEALFPQLGATVAIRTLVHNYIKRMRASLAPVDLSVSPQDLKELLDDDRDATDDSRA